MDIALKTDNFLRGIGVHPDLIDIEKISGDFSEEMSRGLRGDRCSLEMIPCHVPVTEPPDESDPVIALDVGGTNFRRAMVRFSNGRPVVADMTEAGMPGIDREITLQKFLDFICEYVEPVLESSRRIGLCFSYAFESTPDLDGRVTSLSKEVKISGIEGAVLGEALSRRLSERGMTGPCGVTVINDTAACLLGGTARHGFRNSCAGLIIGTGLNICYLERGSEIKKLPGAGDMIVNMEAGNFNRLPFGEPDRLLDAKTQNPGEHLLEKMVSGAYIGSLILETLHLAAASGLFSKAAAGDILELKSFEMSDTDRYLDMDAPPLCHNGDDATALKTIINAAYSRAAKLVCAALVALERRSSSRLYVTVEGSAFHKSPVFRKKLLRLVSEGGLDIETQSAEYGNLAGAALASLTKKPQPVKPPSTPMI